MKLIEIISIAGKPGLYKLLNSTRMPFTVEDLSSGRKLPVFARDRVTALGDISIYTEEGDKPLEEVFEAIQAKYPDALPNEKEIAKEPATLHAFMEEVLPIYDKERVRPTDIKKLVKWFNILREAGMTTFVEPEEGEAQAESEE
ncbi:MAG: DUF5606 domain-containing protein [Porphyromonas sp.]|nr:DUF5606 domain-containing protein [Porphyromonas sp.]